MPRRKAYPMRRRPGASSDRQSTRTRPCGFRLFSCRARCRRSRTRLRRIRSVIPPIGDADALAQRLAVHHDGVGLRRLERKVRRPPDGTAPVLPFAELFAKFGGTDILPFGYGRNLLSTERSQQVRNPNRIQNRRPQRRRHDASRRRARQPFNTIQEDAPSVAVGYLTKMMMPPGRTLYVPFVGSIT